MVHEKICKKIWNDYDYKSSMYSQGLSNWYDIYNAILKCF